MCIIRGIFGWNRRENVKKRRIAVVVQSGLTLSADLKRLALFFRVGLRRTEKTACISQRISGIEEDSILNEADLHARRKCVANKPAMMRRADKRKILRYSSSRREHLIVFVAVKETTCQDMEIQRRDGNSSHVIRSSSDNMSRGSDDGFE